MYIKSSFLLKDLRINTSIIIILTICTHVCMSSCLFAAAAAVTSPSGSA